MQSLVHMALVGAIISFGASVYLFTAALHEARIRFPLAFQGEESARYALDTFIWARPITTGTRRKYLFAIACLSIAAGCAAFALSFHGLMPGALGFGGLCVVGALTVLSRLIKHRELF